MTISYLGTAMKFTLPILFFATTTIAAVTNASAQDYPVRPITLVVPYAPAVAMTSWRASLARS